MTSPGTIATDTRDATASPGPAQADRARSGWNGRPGWPPRRRRRPAVLLASSALVATALALPLVFLLIEAKGAGLADVWRLMARPLTGQLLWNTVRLTVTVTALSAVIGTAAAWCTERTDLPGRRVWAALVVVPLAIPDFVVSFGWFSLWSWVQGFRGAVIVLTLAVYPLVYLPVAASFRSADPGQEEVARSLGTSRVATFFRITIRQARGAILGGCVLVALVLLAEYGAFEILGYQTFTTEIFSEINTYAFAGACALSLVLVLLSLVVLGGEAMFRGRGLVSRAGPLAQRKIPPKRLGRARWPVLFGFGLLVALALGVPVGASVYWMLDPGNPGLTGGVSLLTAAWHTAEYGVLAAALSTAACFPVAMLALRHRSRIGQLLERSTFIVLAMPGIVIAFALSYFVEIYGHGFGYDTTALLVICYSIMFFPLALVGVKASLARAPAKLDEIARSLGQRQLAVLWRVTLRLAGPGLVAAFCLVFLSVVTELTATLLLLPTGVQTLATQFWEYQSNLSYGQAAPFALVMIAVAAVPSYLLGRFFDRSTASRR
ncbi:MAG TPA: iron ABC transporter permease [Streptosporangiaceae bacterium]|nr:iron ABC transporter permease [Streptosporangiaceae bacterium]